MDDFLSCMRFCCQSWPFPAEKDVNNIFPFTNITSKKLQSVFNNKEYHVDDYIDNLTNTCLVFKPQENLTNLFNGFNHLSSDQNSNSENIITCKFYDIDEIQTLKQTK